ncbi:MAG: AzlC family ABC transporter permease [Oscillospiraceae bacterium]|nr:AzlC family ABC transporter permease [Oscillospiraceae bacterium]
MEQNSFKKGITDGLPICVGYFSVSFAFGIFAVASGLTVLQALLISMTNLTSAGQLAAVPIICAGGGLIELAISQLVINSRYALMSVSLSQKLAPNVKGIHRFLVAFGNTDEIFAVSVSNKGTVGYKYMYGLILTPVLGWSAGTVIGAVAGNILPAVVTTSLGVAIYGMFIAIVVPQAKSDKAAAMCVFISVILSCAFKYIPVLNTVPSGFVIIICAVAASVIMALVAPIKIETEEVEADAVH